MTKEDFLARIRGALHRSAGAPQELPPPLLVPLDRWDIEDMVVLFKKELEAVGGTVHVVSDMSAARDTLRVLLKDLEAASFICTTDAVVEELLSAVSLPMADDPAEADVGLSGARCALATTGSLVLTSEVGRKASLLPMNHVALLQAKDIVPTMAEALEHYLDELPSAWVQATGPSRTADIELTLTTGVHGPGVVHVILVR